MYLWAPMALLAESAMDFASSLQKPNTPSTSHLWTSGNQANMGLSPDSLASYVRSNSKKQILAWADRSLDPRIHLVEYPGFMDLVPPLRNASQMTVSALAFSSDGFFDGFFGRTARLPLSRVGIA